MIMPGNPPGHAPGSGEEMEPSGALDFQLPNRSLKLFACSGGAKPPMLGDGDGGAGASAFQRSTRLGGLLAEPSRSKYHGGKVDPGTGAGITDEDERACAGGRRSVGPALPGLSCGIRSAGAGASRGLSSVGGTPGAGGRGVSGRDAEPAFARGGTCNGSNSGRGGTGSPG